LNAEYLVTHATYACSPGDHEAAGGARDDEFFRCNAGLIKAATQFRPPRVAPRPLITGLQSAKVIGPKGKEIWTDSQGRIRIRFHWQRPEEDAAREEASAIWVRVAQVMAGAGWGALQIPRIGHEVVVSFLEGDPDRPIVVGCVYNDTNKPPFDPSSGGMVLGMKSDSTPGGGGYNEFSLDDSKGNEKIKIHGQYDMETTIENDETATIKNNRTVTVVVNHTENVGGDQMVTVDKNQTTQVGINQTVGVIANQDTTVGGNHTMTVSGSSTESVALFKQVTVAAAYIVGVGGAMATEIAGLSSESVGLTKSVSVGGSSSEDITGGKSVKAGKALELKAGADAAISAGKKIAIKAGDDLAISGGGKGVIEIKDELTIKVGSAQITLKKNGDITIKGNKINVKGGGNLVLKGSKILQNS
jgi:type VI secretion system secreted protein VgrG